MCLQFWYRTAHSQPCFLSVLARDPQPLSTQPALVLHHANLTVSEWRRVYVILPTGSHRVAISAQRHNPQAGIAVDDIIMRDCVNFGTSFCLLWPKFGY